MIHCNHNCLIALLLFSLHHVMPKTHVSPMRQGVLVSCIFILLACVGDKPDVCVPVPLFLFKKQTNKEKLLLSFMKSVLTALAPG